MTIKYRAIHTTRPWRKAQHSSLQKAIDGPDGAKNLLMRIGRVGQKWTDYGAVFCVFFWDTDRDSGYAFRLKPDSSQKVEMAVVPIHLLERHELAKGCSASDIESYFRGIKPLAPSNESEVSIVEVETNFSEPEPNEQQQVSLFPDELPKGMTYPEGLARTVLVNSYERSELARKACINHYGFVCQVCLVNFEKRYGEVGHGYIHVHHLVPVSYVSAQYQVDPIKDLIPVCPNCHAMLHRRNPPFTIEELSAKLNDI